MDEDRRNVPQWTDHEVDLTELDDEDWDAVEAAVDELRSLPESERVRRFDQWRKSTASGAFLTAVAFGLAQAFGKDLREEIPIHIEGTGPPGDDPFAVDLGDGDGEDASHAVVMVKPWLLNNGQR